MLYIAIIILLLLYFYFKKDNFKSITKPFSTTDKIMTIDDKYNSKKVAKEKELNALLEKINKKGYENLSLKDKNRLNELSKK